MKKILNILGITILTLFSFYYTNKMVNLVKSKDVIMKKIMANKELLITKPVNAYITNDYIIPGIVGTSIDIDKSYYKMKELGSYNENLYIFINDYPKVSLKDNYNKFIVGGNPMKNNISLIFKLNTTSNLDYLLKVLKDNNTIANLFIDGKVFEDKTAYLTKIVNNNNLIGNLGYDLKYDRIALINTNNLIEKVIKYNNNYCYLEEDNYDILNTCSKLKMHTIKSVIVPNTNAYSYLKDNLKAGGIYTLDINSYTLEELPIIIKYIKQKNYKIVTIEELIDETY